MPLMLVKPYAFEMVGRLSEALELSRPRSRPRGRRPTRTTSSGRCPSWGFALYHVGDLDAAIETCEESARVGGRLVGGTMPAGGGGPGWMLAAAQFELGELDRGFETMRALGGGELHQAIPVERCFYWETLAIAELARGRTEEADAYARRAEEHAAQPRPRDPRGDVGPGPSGGAPARGRGARGGPGGRGRPGCGRGGRRPAAGRLLAHPPGPGAGVVAGERERAIEALREAESDFDRFGCLRERDARGESCASSAPGPSAGARRRRRTPGSPR